MEPFTTVTSSATPLLINNVDTDVITPINRIMQGGDALVTYAFESLRYSADGELESACPLNDPRNEGAEILLAGENFGCGSSRETAVWAVKGLGYRVVIAPSFGDIFFSNCFKNGVLPIRVDKEIVQKLVDQAGNGLGTIKIDLPAQTVTSGDISLGFEISALRKEVLLDGLDDLGLIARRSDAIASFEERDRTARPWVYLG